MANSIQVDTAVQLLIEKGFFTEVEFLTKMKRVQIEYMKKASMSLLHSADYSVFKTRIFANRIINYVKEKTKKEITHYEQAGKS